jgi:Fe-S-cluster containining protein
MDVLGERSYFFDLGLRFECKRCGECCTGAPGVVRVVEADILRISRYIGMTATLLKSRFVYPYGTAYSLREEDDGRCIFYGKVGCVIYPVRPQQCSTYPFWFSNLRSEADWEKARQMCPGIGCGPIYGKEEILQIVYHTFRGEPV